MLHVWKSVLIPPPLMHSHGPCEWKGFVETTQTKLTLQDSVGFQRLTRHSVSVLVSSGATRSIPKTNFLMTLNDSSNSRMQHTNSLCLSEVGVTFMHQEQYW